MISKIVKPFPKYKNDDFLCNFYNYMIYDLGFDNTAL